VRQTIAKATSHEFSVVSNPEFLKQGAAVEDFLKPDRVVIGAEDARAAELMRELYRPFTRTGAPIMVMDCASAELCKYAANAMLATRISFMNEIANVCELFGADADKVRQAMASDKRIGPAFLFPGVGYGGSCFPKDVKAIIKFASDLKYRFRILEAVESVNERQKTRLLARVDKHFGKTLHGRTVAVWGLAFKPRTDDMREAPAVPIIAGLLARGARVRAFDPEATASARRIFKNRVFYAKNAYDALKAADALLIVTEWNEFREPDFVRIKTLLRQPLIFDGRNIYDPAQVRALGFTYSSIGRP
jgi:UDPglucose 6-dehydrogenase